MQGRGNVLKGHLRWHMPREKHVMGSFKSKIMEQRPNVGKQSLTKEKGLNLAVVAAGNFFRGTHSQAMNSELKFWKQKEGDSENRKSQMEDVCVCPVCQSVSLWLYWLAHLAPYPWSFSVKDTEVGCCFLQVEIPPGDLPSPGFEPVSSAWQMESFTTKSSKKP